MRSREEISRYTCIDSFCGAGGLALGLQTAGFRILASFDANACAVRTYRANLAPHCLHERAENLTAAKLRAHAGFEGPLDLFSGGPPCQGFSRQKRGAEQGDRRNQLILEYARLVRELRPRFFLMENVDQLGQKRGRAFVAKLGELLADYRLHPHFYNSADFGVAQTRVRFVVVGKHKSIRAEFVPPEPNSAPRTTVAEAFAGIPEPPLDGAEHPGFANHYRSRVTPINIERFSHVPPGGGWWDIPEHLRLPCHRNVDRRSGGWPDVYGRLQWDGQAPTITAGFDSFTRGRYGHPAQNRAITPREAATLQGFPLSWRFFGNRGDVRLQIGNAVPPPLAEALGRCILQTLRAEDCSVIGTKPEIPL